MSTKDLEAHYRELNVAYGVLEAVHRLRHEVTDLRRLQAKQMERDLWGRLNAAGLLLAAAIPAIYALLPDDAQKELWITPLVVLSLIYVGLCTFELLRKQERALPVGDIDSYYQPEDNPRFLSLLLNSNVTRLGVAKRVLGGSEDESVRKHYQGIATHYENSILDVVNHIDNLWEQGKISRDRRDKLMSFVPDYLQNAKESGSAGGD